MTEESPLANIFDHAFPLADELSVHVNNSINKMVADGKVTNQTSDAIIIHTISLMLMICLMNREVLESGDLEVTFNKVKGVTEQYLKHVLDLPRDRKWEGDDDDSDQSATTTLNS